MISDDFSGKEIKTTTTPSRVQYVVHRTHSISIFEIKGLGFYGEVDGVRVFPMSMNANPRALLHDLQQYIDILLRKSAAALTPINSDEKETIDAEGWQPDKPVDDFLENWDSYFKF